MARKIIELKKVKVKSAGKRFENGNIINKDDVEKEIKEIETRLEKNIPFGYDYLNKAFIDEDLAKYRLEELKEKERKYKSVTHYDKLQINSQL